MASNSSENLIKLVQPSGGLGNSDPKKLRIPELIFYPHHNKLRVQKADFLPSPNNHLPTLVHAPKR